MSEVSHAAIALVPASCTSCLICVRECPAWCIELDSHVEPVSEPGARRPRSVSVLDRFAIDYALCMYCGICVEVCPFDALHWVGAPVEPAGTRGDLVLGTDELAGLAAPTAPEEDWTRDERGGARG